MSRMRNNTRELVVLTILLAIAVSVVNAAVFVYYPISIDAKWELPPVYFDEGTNANKPDLFGNIGVILEDEGTSAKITVHPSRRGVTYYKDVLRIVNKDTKAYYIGFIIDMPFDHEHISEALLILRDASGDFVGAINLKSTVPTWVPWTRWGWLRIDLLFIISSGSGDGDSASITLVYSPQKEPLPEPLPP